MSAFAITPRFGGLHLGLGLLQRRLGRRQLGLSLGHPALRRSDRRPGRLHRSFRRGHRACRLVDSGRRSDPHHIDPDRAAPLAGASGLKRRLAGRQPGLEVERIQFHQQVAFIDPLVVRHVDLRHVPRHAGADRNNVPIDKGVVGALMDTGVEVIAHTDRDGDDGQQSEHGPDPRSLGGLPGRSLFATASSPSGNVKSLIAANFGICELDANPAVFVVRTR